MAFTDYTSLKAAVASWLHRDDLTALIPDFIRLAETHLNADLEAREMETRLPIILTANNAFLALPSDLLEMRRLSLATSPVTVLKYATPDQIAKDFASGATYIPQVFTVIGESVQLAPIPDSAYTGELVYRQALPPLSDTNTTNWLLTKYPNAYLYGSMLAAQFYVEDENKLAMIQAAYGEAIDNINSVDWYSGSTMAVRAH